MIIENAGGKFGSKHPITGPDLGGRAAPAARSKYKSMTYKPIDSDTYANAVKVLFHWMNSSISWSVFY